MEPLHNSSNQVTASQREDNNVLIYSLYIKYMYISEAPRVPEAFILLIQHFYILADCLKQSD